MERYYYIHKYRVVKRDEPLPLNAGYPLTSNISEQEEKYVKLSAEQCDFVDENPGATIQEIWTKVLIAAPVLAIPELTAEEKRELAYEARIPRKLIDAYTTYLAEGKTEEAASKALEIAEIKNQIREEIPD